MLARSLLIFGLHVHVGMPDRQSTIEIMNMARYFLPHLLALSTSSPFWMGRETGLKSYRTTVFRRFPRTGLPEHFESWGEFEDYVQTLVDTRCIDNGKKIWWDVRPHPQFGTLEFRVCDVPTRPADTMAIAALIQAIVYKLYRLRTQNLGFREYRPMLIQENKWRAARYGIDGNLIDLGKRTEVPMRELALELLALRRRRGGRTGQPAAGVGHPEHPARRHERRPAAARLPETQDLKAVVRHLVAETRG